MNLAQQWRYLPAAFPACYNAAVPSQRLQECKRDLAIANRILAHEGVVDAYGHVSVRHPERPDRYLLSRSRSPELVAIDDVMEFDLDGVPVDPKGRTPYLERFIHGAVYEARPDVHSVVHNHSEAVVPYTVTPIKLRPVAHVGAVIGESIPNWDIRRKFGDTNLLVTDMAQGRDLAQTLAGHRVALMRGHGCVVTGRDLREAVFTSIYLQVNARLQSAAMRLSDEVQYLTPGEIERLRETLNGEVSMRRAWDYWTARVASD